ncbi:MAG: hypothetical protein KGN77_10920 [Xanthomonadaceae bacterium]|nr:hypothetical protein [Xanthomonadaceae bacterium]MDE1962714.1 hypothetical protein [Xanthomonadaceae bacterium]
MRVIASLLMCAGLAGAPLRFSADSALSSIGNTVTAERLAPGTFRGTTRVDCIAISPDTGWT